MIQIGPWVGEFGWEIMHFVPAARYASIGHDKVIVGCQEGSQALYADFATEFITFPNVLEACCAQGDSNAAKKVSIQMQKNGKRWKPQGLKVGRKKYVQYGTKQLGFAYGLLIHARDTPKVKYGRSSLSRNWPHEKWEKVVDAFPELRIAAIGLVKESWCPHGLGVDDFRGADLSLVMDLMASSTLLAGPQSGPIHLAALCRCPTVVWTRRDSGPGKHKNQARLTKLWNPFHCRVKILDGWDIAAGPVIGAIKEEIECIKLTACSV